MPFNTIQLEHHPQGHASLWLNRPARHNAFNAQMIDELLQALEQLHGNDRLRLLVLRGRGRHFSAGADIEWMREAAELDYAANLRDAEALGELMYRLYQLPMPTLAVVQGAAFGGALGLIACCDLALGAEDAQLSLSEVRIGLAPAVISPYVVKAIGERATRRLAISAERISGEQARALGLLTETAPADALEALVQEASRHSLTRELRRHTEQSIARIRVSPEGQEGLRAFLEKRPPNWSVEPES